MPAAIAEILAIALLVASLTVAVVRPRGLDEATIAVPAAVLLVILGVVPLHAATQRLREIGPTVGFLAAILVFGQLCAEAGVFAYLGAKAANASAGRPQRLLALIVAIAACVTAVLTLDATVVLLTPVVVLTTRTLGLPSRPHLYACTRIANSGSLVLPVSNLTNLLAFGASAVTFGRFAALMVLPWFVACGAELLSLRLFFRGDLRSGGDTAAPAAPVVAPRYALVVLAVTVALFGVTSSVHIAPAWAALLGCAALAVPRIGRREVRMRRLIEAASLGFCAFVLALAVLVDGVTRHGLGTALADLIPSTTGFVQILAIAALAATLANLVNNLPATLALVPLVATSPAAVLAVLVGVNIGPNATYPGSLATLLWRRLLPHPDRPRAAEFHAFGIASTPIVLFASTGALWVALRVIGA